MKKIKIAIDGPAASGKSTTARAVAGLLKYTYIDSGAMYRCITFKALQEGVSLEDSERLVQITRSSAIEFKQQNSASEVYLDGVNVSEQIRTPEVTRNIRPLAANARIREILVEKQRFLGKEGGVVMDGRDITTVVFPDAELKIYMKASIEARARRRIKELAGKGIAVEYTEVLQELVERDRADSTRKESPLKQSADAIVIDTTALSFAEQVNKIYRLAIEIIQKSDI